MIRNSKPPSENGVTSPNLTLYADPQQLHVHYTYRTTGKSAIGSLESQAILKRVPFPTTVRAF